MNYYNNLEFNMILNKLSEYAISESAKNRILNLKPFEDLELCKRKINETTEAKEIINRYGNPPMSQMKDLNKNITLASEGQMLSCEELTEISGFINACNRMKKYLSKALETNMTLAYYGQGIIDLSYISEEIEGSIQNNRVSDLASGELRDIRNKLERKKDEVRQKLEGILRSKKEYFTDSFVVTRNSRSVLPVKKAYKNKIKGLVVDKSSSGETFFIEPVEAQKLTTEIEYLAIDEENEVRRILYILSDMVATSISEIKANMEFMDELDFVFAKGKYSLFLNSNEASISDEGEINLIDAKHPLLNKESCIPLDIKIGGSYKGVIITGPNTGGKTVSIKTVGLLSLMIQSGLHVTASPNSLFSFTKNILCDIGDGQNISSNLSTFSAHITNIINILKNTEEGSLVLLDELGSGTDPKEGMGIAISIIKELLYKKCLFLVTSHYAEVKDFAEKNKNIINARMEFNKDTLLPTYKLISGESGESCALYIAEKLGLDKRILKNAYNQVYNLESEEPEEIMETKPIIRKTKDTRLKSVSYTKFNIGDSVMIYPEKENGIIYKLKNERGDYLVQVKKEKKIINHKRIKLLIKSEELYPADYDFSIIFDSVDNRKIRHKMNKRHLDNVQIELDI